MHASRFYVVRSLRSFTVYSRPRDLCRSGSETVVLVLSRAGTVLVLVIEKAVPLTETIFVHDRRDVYRLSIEYVADSFRKAKDLSGLHRHARDPWLRGAPSIPLNIAEGNGKRSL